jgi:DNA-directed RNA polymerase specialized sigma24 family protein
LSIRLTGREKGRVTEPSPEATVVGQHTVNAWLTRLPPGDRDVILLFNAGFNLREASEILGCSEAAAEKRRSRARERMRVMIEDEREVS